MTNWPWDFCFLVLILPIYDVFCPDVDQFNLFEAQKVKRHLNVLQHVESHFAFLSGLKYQSKELVMEKQVECWKTYQMFARKHLE